MENDDVVDDDDDKTPVKRSVLCNKIIIRFYIPT